MILHLSVFSRQFLEAVSPAEEPHVLISIYTPGDSPPTRLQTNEHTREVLTLCFADLDKPAAGFEEKDLFSDDQAKQILDFVAQHIADSIRTVVVHCDGGLSRSPGVAAALSVIYNGRGSDERWFKTKRPNMRVYRKLLDIAM